MKQYHQLSYDIVTDVCGGEIDVNERGNITSPNYPGNYRVNANCVWKLRVPPGDHVAIKFRTFVVSHDINSKAVKMY